MVRRGRHKLAHAVLLNSTAALREAILVAILGDRMAPPPKLMGFGGIYISWIFIVGCGFTGFAISWDFMEFHGIDRTFKAFTFFLFDT